MDLGAPPMKAFLLVMVPYLLPAIVSGTIYHPGGRTLFGQTPEAFYVSVAHFDALSVGFNCGVGVDLLRPAVESLAKIARKPISVYPNAGLPDGMGGFTGVGCENTAKTPSHTPSRRISPSGGSRRRRRSTRRYWRATS